MVQREFLGRNQESGIRQESEAEHKSGSGNIRVEAEMEI
jgi:hypothetical protein